LAKEKLNDSMRGFGKEERFLDPSLDWTLENKPASQIKILLVTNYWDDLDDKNRDEPYEKIKECITIATRYPPSG
jgi:hypothetical protein